MKLRSELSAYDVFLFDMDGVVTSEERYFDAAALSVWEILFGAENVAETERKTAEIRSRVYEGDKTIRMVKKFGVNSNWDNAFVIIAMAMILKTDDFGRIAQELRKLNLEAMDLYRYIEEKLGEPRGGDLWQRSTDVFQAWYLGDKVYTERYGKEPKNGGRTGLMYLEQPLFPKEELEAVFNVMLQEGKKLGVGTGRVRPEIEVPLAQWDMLKLFDPERVITYTDIEIAEEVTGKSPLTKPHPYMFYKGCFGLSYDDKRIVAEDFDRDLISKTLVVGDAGADIFAAQAGGFPFCAVLSGIAGDRAFFESNGADLILPDVRSMVTE